MIGTLRCKVVAYAFSVSLFMLTCGDTHAQTAPAVHRVQAVIPDLRSAHQANGVDLVLRALPGVRMCRTDYNTRNLLLEVGADCPISREQVEALLLPFQLSVRCYSRSAPTDRGFVPLDPRSCAETPVAR